jgi:ATP-dependent RNA helicase DDX35
LVGVTLPKRVSVLNIANSLANLGEEVGFDQKVTPRKIQVKVLTDGILVREMLSDPFLSQYSVLVVDDCHERSLYTYISIGFL